MGLGLEWGEAVEGSGVVAGGVVDVVFVREFEVSADGGAEFVDGAFYGFADFALEGDAAGVWLVCAFHNGAEVV